MGDPPIVADGQAGARTSHEPVTLLGISARCQRGGTYEDPSVELLTDLLRSLGPGNSFIILDRLDGTPEGPFAQAYLDPDGSWIVDHRKDGASPLFRALTRDGDLVRMILVEWCLGLPGWRTRLAWAPFDLRPPARVATVEWVEGSPQAAENPPHDAEWRRRVATRVGRRRTGVVEVRLDFELEPARTLIDLDNMVRLALDALRDTGTVPRGLVGIETIVATKRAGRTPGLGTSVVWTAGPFVDNPFAGEPDLVVTHSSVPRDESAAEKDAWRDAVAAAWRGAPARKALGLDIAVTRQTSVAAMLKPVIDGLEPYLGRAPRGRGRLRPLDEQVTWLRISRQRGLPVALRVRAGTPPPVGIGRTVPSQPGLPEMDPDFSFSMSDLDGIDRHVAWRRLFEKPPAGAGGSGAPTSAVEVSEPGGSSQQ